MTTGVGGGAVGVEVAVGGGFVLVGRGVAVGVAGSGVALAVGSVALGVSVSGVLVAPDAEICGSNTPKGTEAMFIGSPPCAVTAHWPGAAGWGAILTNLKRPCASAVTTPRLIDVLVVTPCGRKSNVTLIPAGQSAPITVSVSPWYTCSGAIVI
jgi:hypothetical protein